MNLLIGAISSGFLLSLLTLGLFISYRVMGRLDLTTDGSFGLGAAVSAALLVHGVHPVPATILAAAAGWAAGGATGLMYTSLGIDTLLAGILVTTALYTVQLYIMGGGDISLVSSKSLPDLAQDLGSFLHLPETLTLLGVQVDSTNIAALFLFVGFTLFSIGVLYWFLRTDLGMAMRAAGDNPQAARALGVDTGWMVTLALVLANGLVALAGALFAQYQGFANVSMGLGMIVVGLACLILGEAVTGHRSLRKQVLGTLAGTVLFRLLVAGAVRAGLPSNALKLVTAVFVMLALVGPRLVRRGVQRLGRTEAAA
jgi:putative ABC transport system permease protein